MTALAGWDNFYVIVGSSAGALIGLQFVVMSLIAGLPTARVEPGGGGAFATPTVIHFATVLGLAAILTAPWDGIAAPTKTCTVIGLAGVAYAAIITRKMRLQSVYKPVFEDWLFHVLLPLAAYIGLAVSGYAARSHAREALFGIGGAELMLLFAGIHNAWDAVTYHMYARSKAQRESERSPGAI